MKHVSAAILFFVVALLCSTGTIAQSQSRDQILKDIQTKRVELQTLEKQFLAVAEEDRLAYADLLRQPGTGLVRLLPREVYDAEAYKQNPKTITMRGGGAYYSFTRLTHEYGFGSDIGLESGDISSGFAGLDFGILQKLGDVSLEDASLDHADARFVSSYNPPASEPEVRNEQRRFGMGTTVDEVTYKSRLPVEVNSTFLLRSISYGRTDILVAFRVVRKDADGSVILAWKLLKKYAIPQIARNN
ncbi:MAG TPA: hypothetical protein VE135_26755 [Pyrinomonadaceae bacterium]|nr:hypothetical protein [Pyrinomonadaceae bacterium]